MPDAIADLLSIYNGAVPSDVTVGVGADIAYTIATMMNLVKQEVDRLAAGAKLSTATGLFLDQHARDRGQSRQYGETDDQLRERLSTPPKAGTVSSIQAAVAQIVGVDGTIVIELPLEGWFFDSQAAFFDRSFLIPRRSNRFGGGRGVVVVLIPASAGAYASVTDAVRSKVSAGKLWFVQEYTLS